MLTLSALTLASSFATAFLGVSRLLSKPPRPTGWLWLYSAIALAFCGGALYEWNHASRWELALDYAGSAIMTSAGLLAFAAALRIHRTRHGFRAWAKGSIAWSTAVAAVLLAGYAIRVAPRMVADGWWAGVPTSLLVELSPWLPDRAIKGGLPGRTTWDLASRIERGDPAAWERERLSEHLEKRFRANPSATTLAEWSVAGVNLNRSDALDTILFEKMVAQFFDGTQADQIEAGHVLWNYMPTNGKISGGHIGARAGRHATKGLVPRLIELAANDTFMITHTATNLLAVSGDDAIQAIPMLVTMARKMDGTGRYQALKPLEYLAKDAPAVRQRLVVMTEGPDAFERILAIESLSQWNWHDPAITAHLEKLATTGDSVVSAFALRYLDSLDPHRTLRQVDDPYPAIFAFLDTNSPNRAGYLASVDYFDERHLSCLPRIIVALSDPDPGVRAAACRVLGNPSSRQAADRVEEARDPLTRLLSDPDRAVAQAAKAALASMDRK